MKKILTCILTLSILLESFPIHSLPVFAAENTLTEEETIDPVSTDPEYTVEIQSVTPELDLPDNDALFDMYVEQLLYGNSFAFLGSAAGERLTGIDKTLYDALVPFIKQIAIGERSSATIGLGQTVTMEGETYSADAAITFTESSLGEDTAQNVIDALLADFPYEMYWYDKTMGCQLQCISSSTRIILVQISFTIADNYKLNTDFTVDTSKAQAAAVAATTAYSIIDAYASKNDYEKLVGYKDEICKLVSYDTSAADSGNFSANNDPWQLIYVFDNDPSTNVVCEGYSKAFMYLCDLTAFDGDISCYTVSGDIGGAHMWNIVSIDEKNYLADVTNSDEHTIGADGSLFLVGTTGSPDTGYAFSTLTFTYDENTKSLWGTSSDSILSLSNTNYSIEHKWTAANCITPQTCAICGKTEGEIAPTNHVNTTTKNAVAATCTQEGYTGDLYCLDCNTLLQSGTVMAKASHTYVNSICTVCGDLDAVTSGTCGSINWLYNSDDTLVLYGNGATAYNSSASSYPWYQYRTTAKRLVISSGITGIGNYAFQNFTKIEELYYDSAYEQDFLNSIGYVPQYAFANMGAETDGITMIIGPNVTRIPKSIFNGSYNETRVRITSIVFDENCHITSIGADVFRDCTDIASVYCPNLQLWENITFENQYANPLYHNPTLYINGTALHEYTVPADNSATGTYTFFGYHKLTSITIPEGVTTINKGFFAQCNGITSIEFPSTLLTVEESAFNNCDGLAEIVVPDTVTTIGNAAFYDCNALTSVSLSKNLTSIGKHAFYNCSNLTELPLPDSLLTIGEAAFYCCGLKELTLPAGLTTLSKDAFSHCYNLEKIFYNSIAIEDLTTSNYAFESAGRDSDGISIIFASAVTQVPAYLFANSNLTTVGFAVNSSCTRIGACAFSNCSNLTSVTIPEQLTSLGNAAFYSCTALKYLYFNARALSDLATPNNILYDAGSASNSLTIHFGENVTRIPANLFNPTNSSTAPHKPNITDVVFHKNSQITELPANIFKNFSLKSIELPDKLTTIGRYALSGTDITEIILPTGITTIADYAFENCTNLTDVTFECGPVSFGSAVFNKCTSLCNVYASTLESWLLNTYSNSLSSPLYYATNLYIGGELLTELDIPAGTQSIPAFSFYNCSSIRSLTIPESVTSIGTSAFYKCTNLEEVQYNAVSVTDFTSSSYVFSSAGSSGNGIVLTIGANVRHIPSYLFVSSSKIDTIIFEEGSVCESIGLLSFNTSNSPLTVYIPDANHWATIHFSGVPFSSVEYLYVDDQPTTSLVIDKATCINDHAFRYFTCLTNVTLGDSVTQVGQYAFGECKNLTTVTLSDSVSAINYCAFYYCSNLSSIHLGKGVTTIGTAAFARTGLQSIVFPENVSLLEAHAFDSCTSLSSITFQGPAPTIESEAFIDVTATVYYPAAKEGWSEDVKQDYFGNLTWIPYCLDNTHSFTEYISNNDATCTENGTETATCDYCDQTDVRIIPNSALKHSFSNGTCTRCGYSAPIASGICGESLFWNLNSAGTLTISGNGSMYDFDTSLTAQNPVPWRDYQYDIKSVVIEQGVTSIGANAFNGCTSLITAVLPTSLLIIGDSSFFYCTNIKQLTIPSSVTSIGEWAFANSGLTSLTIPASVTTIADHVFVGCTALTGIYVQLTNPAYCNDTQNALYNKNMTRLLWGGSISGSYTIPSTVTSIDDYAFDGNTKLTEVTIPAGIEQIGFSAFACENLRSILFLGNAPSFGYIPFFGVTATALYPDYNDTWTSNTFPNDECNLTWIPYDSEILDLGTCGSNISWMLTADGTLTLTGSGAMENYDTIYTDTYAPWFAYREQVKKVIIEDGITTIGSEAFYEMHNLTNINLPESLVTIGDYAFYFCSSLTSLKLPNYITQIGDGAFLWCENMTEIHLSNRLTTIGASAFGSSGITTITIPASVTYIGEIAFCPCANLKTIYFKGNAPEIGDYVLSGCSATAYYPQGDSTWTAAKRTAFDGDITWIAGTSASGTCGPNLTWDLHMNGTLTITGNGYMTAYSTANPAPWRAYKVLNVVLEDGVKSVGDYAFYNCNLMYSISLPDSLEDIGYWSFYNCSSLLEISIPDNVYLIGNDAFIRCSRLVSVKLPGSLENIYDDTFKECESLSEITIPSGVTRIYERAFSSCYDLDTIIFLGDAPQIDSTAFTGVSADVYFPEDNESWTFDIMKDYGGSLTWIVPVVPLDTPTLHISNVPSTGKIKLTWNAIEGAEKYEVYRSTNNETWTLLKTTTGTSLTNTSTTAGNQYYYKVRAINSTPDAASEFSAILSRTCDLPRPTVNVSNVASTGKIKLTWDLIDGAVNYKVYRSTDNKTWTLLKTTSGTSLTNTSTTAGTKYYYKVYAIHSNTSANSAYSSIVSRTCDLARPTVSITNVASNGKIKLTWKKVDGAKSYKVYRSTDNKTWSLLKETTGTSLTNTSTTAGKKYYYKVLAVHTTSAANSAYSSVVSRTCDLARPVAKVTLNSSGKPVISWAKISSVSKYKVYIYDSKGTLLKTSTTTSTKLTHSSATKGKKYTYRVEALHSTSAANSAKSTSVSITSK